MKPVFGIFRIFRNGQSEFFRGLVPLLACFLAHSFLEMLFAIARRKDSGRREHGDNQEKTDRNASEN